MRLIAGLDAPTRGEIRIGDQVGRRAGARHRHRLSARPAARLAQGPGQRPAAGGDQGPAPAWKPRARELLPEFDVARLRRTPIPGSCRAACASAWPSRAPC